MKIIYIILILFINSFAFAEKVEVEGVYRNTGDIAPNETCRLAKERAKLKALEKVTGQIISSEELEKCSEVDGKSNCERNQFFLSAFNGEISEIEELDKKLDTETLNSGELIFVCKIKIKAKVVAINQDRDPNFDFDVKLNNYNFREGEKLEINIDFNQNMYLTVFQILPYEDNNYQVYKLFPLGQESNYIEGKSLKLPKKNKYEIYFPENIKKKSIDEYLFFIGSKDMINWLDKYSKFEDLKKEFIKSKSLVKWKYKEYTIIK